MALPPTELIVLALAGYLVGSIQFSRLVSRRQGLDLERTGSGVASVANVWHSLGVGPAAIALACDFGKAAATVGLARSILGEAAAGLLAVGVMVGHNWPLFTRFNGGRGMLVTLGAALVLLPTPLLVLAAGLGPLALALRDSAPPAAALVLLLPIAAVLTGAPTAVALAFGAIAAIALARRATAPPPAPFTWRTLLSRLVFDRPDPKRKWTLDPETRPRE